MWQLWFLCFEGDSWCRWERQGGYVRWFWKPGETLAGWESLVVYNTGLYMTFLIVREGKEDRNSETQCCYRVSDCLASEQLRLRECLFYLPVNLKWSRIEAEGSPLFAKSDLESLGPLLVSACRTPSLQAPGWILLCVSWPCLPKQTTWAVQPGEWESEPHLHLSSFSSIVCEIAAAGCKRRTLWFARLSVTRTASTQIHRWKEKTWLS